MKIIISLPLIFSLLFSIDGKIIFNDGTTIKGNINSVNLISASITPEGLTFPEEIIVSNIDSLKLNNGKLLIASNKILFLFNNGEYSDPNQEKQKERKTVKEIFDIEYEIVPNWSANAYFGYPIQRGSGVSDTYIEKVNPIFGLSIGSPYGIFIDDFFMNVISEIAYYNFYSPTTANQVGKLAFQIGLSPGLFIGNYSLSFTACTGYYSPQGLGFITGLSIDIPFGDFVLRKFEDNNLVDNYKEYIESLELRVTSRGNIIQKNDGEGYTEWVDLGISIGYEF
jgi:hypothetical protein